MSAVKGIKFNTIWAVALSQALPDVQAELADILNRTKSGAQAKLASDRP